jgi:hypothetical protein
MRKLITIIFVLSLGWAMNGCGGGGGGGTPDPNAGFKIETFAYHPQDPSVYIPTAGNVQGQFLYPNGATTGTVESFNRNHGGVGLLVIPGARVPARWRLTLGPDFFGGSHCLTFETVDRDVSLNSVIRLFCRGRFFGFTASPNTLDALNPPATMTFNGKGIENVYGTPALAFYDEYGYVVASTQASQLLYREGEIEGLEIVIPDISQVYDGVYTIAVHNIRPDGSWEVIGAAPVTIYGNPPPPPPGGGGGGCEPQPPDQQQLPCDQQQQY